MNRLAPFLRKGTQAVAAGMLAALFAVFLLQIAGRYLMETPLGWTVEVSLTLWLWIVFWGGAFCLQPADHIRFDVLYLSVRRPVQRLFSLIAAIAIVAAFAISFLPTWDYVSFYSIKRSAILRVPLSYVFWIYLLFMAVVILRYGWVIVGYVRGRADLEGGSIVAYDLLQKDDPR